MAHIAIAIKNRNLNSLNDKEKNVRKTKSCNYPRRFARYLYFVFFLLLLHVFSFFQSFYSCNSSFLPKTKQHQTLRPDHYWKLSVSNLLWILNTQRKGNLDSQEVHDITHVVSAIYVPWFMSAQDLFSLESINLYYFNIIKKIYFTHITPDKKIIKRNHK